MSNLSNPANGLWPLSKLGGFDTKLTADGTNPILAKGFMITVDRPLSIRDGKGEAVSYPAGTFIVNTIYYIFVQSVRSNNTTLSDNQIFLCVD